MRLGDHECYFCGADAERRSASLVFDVEVSTCARCGEACDGLLLILESSGTREEAPGGRGATDSDRAEEYEAHAEKFEGTAREALASLLAIPKSDPVLELFLKAASSMATAETMARLVRLGEA